MQKNKFDILHEIENSKRAQNKFDEYTRDTYKYVDKYKNIFPEGHKGGWNDSVDAFRHAFMQAHLKYKYNDFISKNIANLHERNGNKYFGQSKEEEFMDNWNNIQGREIADEVKNELKNSNKNYSDEVIKDYIAYKIIQRMKSGKLITNLDEAKRRMEKQNSTKSNINSPAKNLSYTQPSIKPEPQKTTSQKISDGIRAQYKAKIERNNYLLKRIFGSHFKQTGSGQGHWVTINGTHVFIED